jgi:DNA-binding transcriptional ArsR family regulator
MASGNVSKDVPIHFKLSDLENEGLPKEKLDFALVDDKRKFLSPDARDLISRDEIRRAIKKFGENGITISEISELTGLDRRTIKKHIEKLNGLREIYSQKRGKQLTVYYPNGKPLHQIGSKRIAGANPILDITIAQGPRNALYFYIVEKRYSILEGEVSEGAVMFSLDKLEEVIDALKELKQNLEVMQNG